ncbi:hypothetical protein KHA80_21155 [Anaerobacillus sp. HL2]|nr:hypothetical protein KHA80_21155 [Anaerobacillus sp. HL2]
MGQGKNDCVFYAICYARYIGKPAIIATDEALIDNLLKEEGDIAKLIQNFKFKRRAD